MPQSSLPSTCLHRCPCNARSGVSILGVLLFALFLGIATSASGEDVPTAETEAEAALEHALGLHEAATDFAGEMDSIASFQRATKAHADHWRLQFWSSYVHSQAARLIGRGQGEGDAEALFETANRALERARLLHADPPASDTASFFALEALLHKLDPRSQDTSTSEVEDPSLTALRFAVTADATNPAVLIMVGTQLAADSRTTNDLVLLAAALATLEHADALLQATDAERARTTHFNSEWLPFWIPRLRQALKAAGGN